MPWLRLGDTAAHDPRTIAPLELEDADERTVDEVFGFGVRLACEVTSKETDRMATRAMVRSLAGSPARAQHLMGILVASGVYEATETGWRLINDPNYLHVQSQGEVDRNRIRGRDSRNDALTVNARLRDGDHCRYCKKEVNWRDRKSLRGATWEHTNIAEQPTRLHEFVVCCFECNREPATRGLLLPPPATPRYGTDTKQFVKERLGSWPTKAVIAERLSGLRTAQENASSRQRTGEEHATRKGQRTSTEHAAPGLRTLAENATKTARERPEIASNSALGIPTPDAPKRASTGGDAPPGGDLPAAPLSDLDLQGRDGKGSSESCSAGPGLAGSALDAPVTEPTPPRQKRSRRSKPSTTSKES